MGSHVTNPSAPHLLDRALNCPFPRTLSKWQAQSLEPIDFRSVTFYYLWQAMQTVSNWTKLFCTISECASFYDVPKKERATKQSWKPRCSLLLSLEVQEKIPLESQISMSKNPLFDLLPYHLRKRCYASAENRYTPNYDRLRPIIGKTINYRTSRSLKPPTLCQRIGSRIHLRKKTGRIFQALRHVYYQNIEATSKKDALIRRRSW